MAGSDDFYLGDDIVFDDQTLAVLESAEQKYLTQAISGPPPKRQKTEQGWKPTGKGCATVDDNFEELPEISVHGDGSYAVRGATKGQNTTIPKPQQRVATTPTVRRPTSHSRPEPQSRPRDSIPQPTSHTRAPPAPPARAPPRPVASDVSQAQADEFRKQIEELRRENLKYQVELKEATDAKWSKQGEVSILRKNFEKVAQEHASQVAKLRLAKEESEAKQIALQKEMKAEMERLKTQFIFKQHEIETSSRKQPMSVRSKRVTKDFPSTPLAVPSQIRGWNQNASFNGFTEQSPVRARVIRGSPQDVQTRKTPEKPKKPNKLFGFQNSFTDATPVRPAQSCAGKEKEVLAGPSHLRETSPPTGPIPFPQLKDVTMTDSNYFDKIMEPDAVDMERAGEEIVSAEEIDEIQPFNWKAELTRLILTHTFPPNTSPTFKILVGLDLPPESADRYSNAVTRLLELVASTSHHKDYEMSLPALCQYLTLMIEILNGTDLTFALAALLNLLTCLGCSLPRFTSTLLAQTQGGKDESEILEISCTIICTHLGPSKRVQLCSDLGNEVVGLLEGLCWNVKDDLIDRLAMLCNRKDILMTLLDPSQSWLLARSTRLLVFLATHPQLSRDLLSGSEQAAHTDGGKANDGPRHPYIERLCSCLTDKSQNDAEAADAKSQILTFFGMLSVAHADVHASLLRCQALVPSLVAFVTQMTTLLWEGDQFFTEISENVARTIRTLNQTLFLLHHLLYGLEPNFNLRHRLHYAPSRTFNGITHMFIVTFGRLSCADPPEWIESGQKAELEAMSEIAQDLLDLVVDGPEGDSIWAAYQVEDVGNNSDTDEEDMEANLLGTY
ncbi:hypothetical protein C8R43DRAFT_1117814 [Mycena crocata]|nr:hypothetical protein C8R43DRAFT_1117814 [Mycena crocata]